MGFLAAVIGPTPASAEGPPAELFEIYYYVTDEDGEKSRRMTLQDLQQFVNQARCDCVQNIVVDVTLRNTAGAVYDEVQLTPFIGTQCDQGQLFGVGAGQCVTLEPNFPMAYTRRKSFEFAPIWLASPVDPRGSQGISSAEALYGCIGGQGAGGLWMCSENNGNAGCQIDEFIMQGTQNNNVPQGEMSQAIQFDFDPPIAPPSEFEVAEGDGAVEISWQLGSTADIAGYRILCANADGSPVEGQGTSGPDPTDENQGTIYYTAENLCPEGAFNDGPVMGEEPVPPDDDGGTGTGDFTWTGTGTTGTGGLFWEGYGLDTTSGTGTGTGSGSGTGTGTGTTTGTGSGTGTGTGTGDGTETGTLPPPTGIETLDWRYVCSGHISGTSTKGRVSGLTNDTEYQFLVVAYDKAGNPSPSTTITATPIETNDLWENCEDAGDVCGKSGFCACRADDEPPIVEGFLALGVLGLVGRRRRRRRAA